MSNKNIKQLLTKLHDEIQKTEIDSNTRTLIQKFDSDMHNMINTNSEAEESNFLLERAKSLETDFAARYPTAERCMKEVIDALVKMGI